MKLFLLITFNYFLVDDIIIYDIWVTLIENLASPKKKKNATDDRK